MSGHSSPPPSPHPQEKDIVLVVLGKFHTPQLCCSDKKTAKSSKGADIHWGLCWLDTDRTCVSLTLCSVSE